MAGKQNKTMSASARVVFGSLKNDIILGRVHPRERLVEADLVEKFKSHRPAVREALAALVHLGLVVHVPNKGASVAEVSLDELEQIFRMRTELEALAVQWMPLPLSQEAIAELVAIQKEHTHAVSDRRYGEIFRLDLEFHGALNAHCGNHHLEEMIDLMSTRGLLVRYSAFMDDQFLGEVRDEHLAVIEAIRQMDRENLVALMRAHNIRGLDWFAENTRRQRTENISAARDERLVSGN